jgi:hypothetical protein
MPVTFLEVELFNVGASKRRLWEVQTPRTGYEADKRYAGCKVWKFILTWREAELYVTDLKCVASVPQLLLPELSLGIYGGFIPGPSVDTEIHRCSNPLCKMP